MPRAWYWENIEVSTEGLCPFFSTTEGQTNKIYGYPIGNAHILLLIFKSLFCPLSNNFECQR